MIYVLGKRDDLVERYGQIKMGEVFSIARDKGIVKPLDQYLDAHNHRFVKACIQMTPNGDEELIEAGCLTTTLSSI